MVRTQALAAGYADVVICRLGPAAREDAASCAAGLDNNCDGLVGSDDPQCQPFMKAGGVAAAAHRRGTVMRPPRLPPQRRLRRRI